MMNAPSRSRLVAMLMCFIVGLALALTSAEARQQPTDTQVYERYRAWVSGPATAGMRTEAEVLSAYRKVLADEGLPGAEIDRRLRVISENGRRLEVERWNRILTAPTPIFNVQP